MGINPARVAVNLNPVAVPCFRQPGELIFQKLSHTPAPCIFVDSKAADARKVAFYNQLGQKIKFDFLTQLVVKGDFARISCFAVDEDARSRGVGKLLEDELTRLAKARNCDRIEVHCHSRRVDAHRFYERQGYQESPKYFFKSLIDQE